MKRKIISAVCAIFMVAALTVLAGCGGSGGGSSSSGATITGSGN